MVLYASVPLEWILLTAPETDISPWGHMVDVKFRGRARLIGCAVLDVGDGRVLIDPGPTSALETLERALGGFGAVKAVFLTHIHLDHAGATGTIVRKNPQVQVHVHPLGAAHLVDPSRLIRSATRIYGARMDPLWGAIEPVPRSNVHSTRDHWVVRIGRRALRARHTPGHARHHVAWFDDAHDVAFVGDAAGLRIEGSDHIIPVAPPPDIDLAAWENTIALLEGEAPARMLLTHFGIVEEVLSHLKAMRARLDEWSEDVRRSLDEDASDAERAQAFHAAHMADMRHRVPESMREPYEYMGQPVGSWYGLARYWRKHGGYASGAGLAFAESARGS